MKKIKIAFILTLFVFAPLISNAQFDTMYINNAYRSQYMFPELKSPACQQVIEDFQFVGGSSLNIICQSHGVGSYENCVKKVGHKFEGWYKDRKFKKEYISTILTSKRTLHLYAKLVDKVDLPNEEVVTEEVAEELAEEVNEVVETTEEQLNETIETPVVCVETPTEDENVCEDTAVCGVEDV